MTAPNVFADLTPSPERLIIRGVYDLVAADQGSKNMFSRGGIHLIEGPQSPGSILVNGLYISGRPVTPKEWPAQRASIFCDVFLSPALGPENFQSSTPAPLVASDIFNYYRGLLNSNVLIPDGLGGARNLPILDWGMTWAQAPEGAGFQMPNMRFRYHVDIDPRDGSLIFGG